MIQDKIFLDEKDPTGLSYNTPFTVYGSYEGRLWSKTPSGEIKYYTQNSDLSVYATTGSNSFNGNQTVTGSLTVTEGITGTATTASYVEYAGVANKPTLVSSSAQVTYSGLTGVPAGIVSSSAQVGEYGVFATTGSNQFNGSQAVTGSLTVTGQVVAQTLNVQQVTSSIVYSSGSNIFGNSLGNTQQFTGSVSVTGSLTVNGALSGTSAAFSSGATFGSTVRPITNFAADLGTSTFRWADIFGYALNLSGGTTVSTRLTIARGSDDSSQNLLLGWNSLTVQRTSVPLSSAQTDFSIIQQGSDSSRTPFYISSGGNIGIGLGTASLGDTLTVSRNVDNNSGGLTLFNANTSGYGSALTFRVNYAGVYNTSRIHGDWDTGNSGNLYFYTANTSQSLVERMRINGLGIITSPYQVSFKAYISGANPELQKTNNITIPYNAEEYDTQGNFSTSTYKFTAPVAGKYLFTVNVNVYGLTDTARLLVYLYINSSSSRYLYDIANLPTGNTGDTNVGGSDILNLTAGDTVEVRIYTDGSGSFGMSNGQTYNSFSGHLLG